MWWSRRCDRPKFSHAQKTKVCGWWKWQWLTFHFLSNPWHLPQFKVLSYTEQLSFNFASHPPPEIKKRKQRLEGVGDDKSHRSIIYRFPDLQHSPQTPHGALQFLRLCSLWRLFIFHFLKGSILTKIKLISLLLCLTVQVGHKSPKLDPNTRLVCHSYQKRMNRYNK